MYFTCILGLASCAEQQEAVKPESSARQRATYAAGTDAALDIASWNIEWFGDTRHGPSDEARQRDNAAEVMRSADVDVWGLAEIVSAQAFHALVAQLDDYTAVLSDDPQVLGGPVAYAASEQKLGLVWKAEVARLRDARIILAAHDHDFAGRPPLQVILRVTLQDHSADAVFIVLHAKCCQQWTRRQAAASALKAYLDSTFPNQRVFVIGDFNDDLDTSIQPGYPSPYSEFLRDPERYRFVTLPLSNAHISTTTDYSETIDHHLVSREAYALYIPDSLAVYRPDAWIDDYQATTSDHYPVLSSYVWPFATSDATTDVDTPPTNTGATANAGVIINEVCANEPGDDVAGEFVEIVNVGQHALDLSGYTLSDKSDVRHVFAAGSRLAAGRALVVFGALSGQATQIPAAVAASTVTLHLGNSGDSVVLRDGFGTTLDVVTYRAADVRQDGVSLNRSPDAQPSAPLLPHTALSALPRSAGARADGTRW